MIKIRPATLEDSRNLFDWRNDVHTRSASISQLPVTWQDHSEWLAHSIADGNRRIYLAEQEDTSDATSAVGMCRFDISADGESAEVSINLNPDFRGHGLAGPVLRAAIERFSVDVGISVRLIATIRHSNAASARIFIGSGFVQDSSDGEYGYYLRA